MGLKYIRKLHHDNKIHISKIHFNASDYPSLSQAWSLPPSLNFTSALKKADVINIVF